MVTPDLFAASGPPVPKDCGACVHLNPLDPAWGWCSPRGHRAYDASPCDMGYPRDQLARDAKGRLR